MKHVAGPMVPKTGPRLPIIRITATQSTRFVSLSPQIHGQLIHWKWGRSHQCHGSPDDCEGCRGRWPQRWKGYLYCLQYVGKHEPCFIELTSTAAELLLKPCQELPHLRGVCFDISKTKGGPKGRFIINVQERVMPETEISVYPPMDVMPILIGLWKAKNEYAKVN